VLAAPAPGRGEKLDEAGIAPGGERLDSPLGPLAAASQLAALHPPRGRCRRRGLRTAVAIRYT
jgi:hypothetical protein